MINKLISLGSPRRCYHFLGKVEPWSMILCLIAIVWGTYQGLYVAPRDYLQGDGFRILYVHVPCAIFSLFIYVGISFLSVVYLIWRIKIADILAYCLAPLGAFFTLAALMTGAIWGKPMWGTWWIWDARLTSELILLFLYLGYIGLYHAIGQARQAAKAAAILSLVGVIDIPIIHYSVYWWNTLHQGATISAWAAPKIDQSMLKPLLWMLVGFALYVLATLSLRARTEILKREQNNQWVISLLNKSDPKTRKK